MNMATDTTNDPRAIADAMATARDAIQSLEELGITVIAVSASNRRPQLFVDRMPDGVVCVTKRHSPTGFGRQVVRATQWQGCQLECMHVETFGRTVLAFAGADAVAGNITMRRLQVVPRG